MLNNAVAHNLTSRVETPGPSDWCEVESGQHENLANGPDLSFVFKGPGNELSVNSPGTWASTHLTAQAKFSSSDALSGFLYSLVFGVSRLKNSWVRVTISANGQTKVFEASELHGEITSPTPLAFLVGGIPVGPSFLSPDIVGKVTLHFDILLEAYLSPQDSSLILAVDALDVRAQV